MNRLHGLVLVAALLVPASALGADPVRVHAAGSLRAVVRALGETYCTNAAPAVRETAVAESVPLPPELRLGADYGLTVLTGARVEPALRWVLFVLSPDGQAILERFGFTAPTRPATP